MSAVTGLTAEECAAAVNAARGRPAYFQTQGVGFNVIGRVIHDLGFRVVQHEVVRPMTIRAFALARSSDVFLRPVLAWTRDHFIALRETTLVDSRHEAGIPWRNYKKLRTKILGWYTIEIDRGRDQGLKDWDPKLHSHYARKRERVTARDRAFALASRLGVRIEDMGDEIEMHAPAGKLFPGEYHSTVVSSFPGEKARAWDDVGFELLDVRSDGWVKCEIDGCDCGEEVTDAD
jgi:hypothetical protein